MITKNINYIAQTLEGLVSEALEGVVPPEILQKGRRSLNFALDLMQPHMLALGLRIAKLTRTQVEVVIPDKERNLDSQGCIQEGVVMAAATESARFLWSHNRPDGNFQQSLKNFEIEILNSFRGPLRVRMELPELVRESAYAELATTQRSEHELQAQVFDASDILLAQIRMTVRLTIIPALQWT
jgi:hypothetical protein